MSNAERPFRVNNIFARACEALPMPASWVASQAEWEWFCTRSPGAAEKVSRGEMLVALSAGRPAIPRSPKRPGWREEWRRKAHRNLGQAPPSLTPEQRKKRDEERAALMRFLDATSDGQEEWRARRR